MLFCSMEFLRFFTAVFFVYWSVPWKAARVWILLAASFYFYASWSQNLALVVFTSTFIDYWLARGMDTFQSRVGRRALLLMSLAGNLGLLFYFKYANFFLESLESTLRAAGAETSIPLFEVILPIGISFYTFEAINYTVDVYRRRVPAERNLAHFMLFITFFPHLVAGPIVRARDFLPQIRRRKVRSWKRADLGIQLFLMGAFKKLAIADRMAMFVDPVFQSPGDYSTYAVWVAVIAYALQIYCDFSGYSDMALGTAHLLGYNLAKNFDMPYLSANVSEFWRRWHISLSTWLRDYLFIPLGGSRGTRLQTARNLILTMTLGGLWHGAAWTFVLWGAYHGLLLIGHRIFQGVTTKAPRLNALLLSWPGTVFRVGLTMFSVVIGWVLFRATSVETASSILNRMFVPHSGAGCPLPSASFWYIIAFVAICHAIGASPWRRLPWKLPAPVLGFGYGLALCLVLLFDPAYGNAFIYFQF